MRDEIKILICIFSNFILAATSQICRALSFIDYEKRHEFVAAYFWIGLSSQCMTFVIFIYIAGIAFRLNQQEQLPSLSRQYRPRRHNRRVNFRTRSHYDLYRTSEIQNDRNLERRNMLWCEV